MRAGLSGEEASAAAAGLCATLVGVGLARFAYAPLLPALIEAGWLTGGEAAYLGAANLMGYLAGAVGAAHLVRLLSLRPLMRCAMLLTALTFVACALDLGFAWFLPWRFLSGVTGGVLLVAAAPAALAKAAPARRGQVAGLVFAGVGIGIVAGGTLLPMLLRGGPAVAWIALGLAALLLTRVAWRAWPENTPPGSAAPGTRPGWPVLAAVLIYAVGALGLVPHMVFLVDFIARGLGLGLATGSLVWVVFGLGAIAGPVLAGRLGDRIGFGRALVLALALQLAAVLVPLTAPRLAPLTLSALVIGAFTPGMPTLVLGRLQEVTRDGPPAWGLATTAFAVAQAGGAYGLSWIYAASGRYDLLFGVGAAALAAALALAVATRREPVRAG